MLDGMNGDKENEKAASPILPALAMVGIIVARTFDVLPLSDHLTRAFLFIPLFCVFLMRIHRETVYKVRMFTHRAPPSRLMSRPAELLQMPLFRTRLLGVRQLVSGESSSQRGTGISAHTYRLSEHHTAAPRFSGTCSTRNVAGNGVERQ